MSNMEYVTCKLLHDEFNKNKRMCTLRDYLLQESYKCVLNGDEIVRTYFIPDSYIIWPRGNNPGYVFSLPFPIIHERKKLQDEYRKFIEENRYGRIANPNGSLSIPRIQFTENNGNNIKYASRRLLDDMGK